MNMVSFENLSIETIDVEEGIRQTIEKEPLDELAASCQRSFKTHFSFCNI